MTHVLRYPHSLAAATALLFSLALPAAHSQTFSQLYSFPNAHRGALPSAGVILDPAGNLYGTTWSGGTYQWGTVFKLTALPHQHESVLHNFTGKLDGNSPIYHLLRDSSGNLYGTTVYGGSYGNGAVFKITPAGKEVVLYSFGARANDGGYPLDLVRDANGNLYGVTFDGGSSGLGTVYKLDTSGHETLLYSFTGANGDGANPNNVFRDSAGNLYGTTHSGGYLNQGTIFKISLDGTETILHTFLGGTDGSYPYGLVADAAGNLYGTTGGAQPGTVFKLDPSGTMTELFTFNGSDGQYPSGRLALDASGNLYGTTSMGGEYGWGTVFKLDPAGNETVLYSFTGGNDGKYPSSDPLAMDSAGTLYGTTQQGGFGGIGVVFKIKP